MSRAVEHDNLEAISSTGYRAKKRRRRPATAAATIPLLPHYATATATDLILHSH